jgi:branched-chain amino acid aminotransferase
MASYYHSNTIVFADGQLKKASEVHLSAYSQTLHYGYGVFEGIRSYKDEEGNAAIFKAEAHYERLLASAEALRIPLGYSVNELIEATYAVLRANQMKDAYIRPLVYLPDNMSFNPNSHSHIWIAAWEMEPFLGENLLRLFTSTIQRPNPKAFNMRAKACGHYVNSIMASYEAKANGFDEALLCDAAGNAAEGPGANLFIEKDGVLFTPPPGNILPGITRQTVLELCDELGIPYAERHFTPQEMKQADSAFYCGTAAEIVGIASLDNCSYAMPWQQTQGARLQKAYHSLVRKPASMIAET